MLLVIGSMIMDRSLVMELRWNCNPNSITGGNGINTTVGIQLRHRPLTQLSTFCWKLHSYCNRPKWMYCNSSTTVLEPDQIVVDTITQDSVSCFGVNDGSAYVGATGGTGVISYLWDASAANQTIDTAIALAAGFYTVRLTDENGCFIDTNATVLEPNLLVVDNTAQDSVLQW